MWFLNQMIMLPVATLFYSLEMFGKTVQGIQEMVSYSMNAMAGEITQLFENTPGGTSDVPSDTQGGNAPNTSQTMPQEERHMSDLDLGGDDLKYVSYSIVFTKRDYEATLQGETQDIVDYATDGGSYGALKIGEFFGQPPTPGIVRPQVWRDNNYPKGVTGDHMDPRLIPSEDRKYVRFIYSVDRRLPKSAADYERRQARALEEISSKLVPGTSIVRP
jgi:hypothetical protein